MDGEFRSEYSDRNMWTTSRGDPEYSRQKKPKRTFPYFNVNSQSIRVALSSLLDSSINRNWKVRLIKSFKAPFRSSRSRAMFWSRKFTNSVQPQQHETELTIHNNLYYRMNYKNLTANLLWLFYLFLLLTIPLAIWFCGRFALHTTCLSGIPTTFETRQDRSLDYVLARRFDKNFSGENNLYL